ncbi:sigma-54-dependent transcriptional regulator [Cupriavidus consociatus]|uniref:sigma-54-dependent transcriptional regulator n=1 Tax=Cupriavidus consociatus TaxID=2821357 RepID=UPI001AE7A8BD|nr:MULTISPECIES: sigma-54 dependent transcriptional regulator [unclassified Cupriavidus]MBP0624445.1 sigma-54-dependent Fis family transcriptional regulator [Cupriavidus sp. LEh25]MDK2661156.1 sigma-54 dependent transcriptional regulator [Cupriavidus sp. LEh21]
MSDTHPIRVIFVEDEEDVLIGSSQALELAGFTVDGFASVEQARASVSLGVPAVVVCDVRLPGMTGVSWLSELQGVDADLPVILMTGHGDISMAVRAMRQGAYDFIEKPCSSDHLVSVVRRAADRRKLSLEVRGLREQLEGWRGIQACLIGRSAQMERVRRAVRALADAPADVVIYGETGTGKDLVARCLHDHSARRAANFVPSNCGGLPESLAESELFGHEVGSFTGATRRRCGKFEHAQGGTLFLDEIESMPLSVQVKFLRALQERSIERVGSNEPIQVDCRVIAASKEDLKLLSEQKKFRADLYYRIGVAFIDLPPLRERREDIPLLFEHLILQAATRFGRPAPVLESAQFDLLLSHSWPGNVRELRNVADRFVLGLLSDDFDLHHSHGERCHSLPDQLEQFERVVVMEEMKRHNFDVAATAKALSIPKQTLYSKLRRLHIGYDKEQSEE